MRLALVTGACGGIGLATVNVFKQAGWRVLAVDRTEPPTGLEFDEFVMLDLTDAGAPEALASRLGADGLDALVNNAAVAHDAPMTHTDLRSFDAVIASNLRAPFHLTAQLQDALSAASGSVVNVSSVHALATSVNVAAYAASKGGLASLTRAVALELAPLGVRCNAVLPGATDTSMLHRGLSRSPHVDGVEGTRRELESRTPLRRVGRPDEVAQAILFLADPERSSFITGQMLVVDGGVLARLASE